MRITPFIELFDHTLGDEYIARTYLMAKNIADTTRLIEQNAQYDIGSNIISRTPGGYDNQVLLSDLQLITLERDQNTGRYTSDADSDGLSDGRELGNEDGTYTPLKISGFIKKLLEAESGEKDGGSLYTMYKANIASSYSAGFNSENNGSIVTEGKDQERYLDSKHNLRVEGDDIMVDVMSYSSNPILKDTDFDGVWDGYGKDDDAHKNVPKDEKPLDNTIAGKITMTNGSDLNVDTHMDYRYFFMDKYNYYDELAVMSLILSNAVYGKNELNLSNLNIINNKIGLNLNYRTVEEENVKPRNYIYKTKYAIGHKSIEYSKDNSATNVIEKVVIPIIIPGMTEMSDGRSYSEIGSPNWIEESKNGNEKHGEEGHNVMSYEIYADAILHDIDSYENIKHLPGDKSDVKKVYWVMGYKEGGAIANVLASKLIDHAKEVYAYTFASPMTLYNNSDAVKNADRDYLKRPFSRTGYLARYDSIFNIVNEMDAYCFVMPQKLGFSRYGMTCFGRNEVYNPVSNSYETNPKSVEKIVESIEGLYKGDIAATRRNTYKKDTNIDENMNYAGLYNVYQRLINAIDIDRNHKEATAIGNNDPHGKIDTIKEFYTRYRNVTDLSTFINTLETYYDKVKRAGQEDLYYYITRRMNNGDILNVVNRYDYRKAYRKATGSDTIYLASIEDMSKWYVDNIATYQRKLQTETIASLDNYNTKLNYITEYKLKNHAKVERKYKVATNNQENSQNKNIYPKATTSILKATENAVNNYKTNYSQITFSGNLAYYPCSDIDTGTDTYKKAGDDCVRFAFACFKKMDSNFISNLEAYSGLTWDNINSTRLAGKDDDTNDKIATAMTKLGFEIYDMDGDDKPVDYDKDHIDDYEIKSITSNFKLQAGDFVACSGHVHFCLEDDNNSRSNTDKDNFGWGSVYREYPKNYSFNVESAGNSKYQINGGGMKYNRVYRYTK